MGLLVFHRYDHQDSFPSNFFLKSFIHSYSNGANAAWFNGTWKLPELPYFVVGEKMVVVSVNDQVTTKKQRIGFGFGRCVVCSDTCCMDGVENIHFN